MAGRTLGVVMDPIQSIAPYKDTTFAMLLAAQRRGWRVEYMELGDLWLRDGAVGARRRALHVEDRKHDWWEFGVERDGPLAELDLVLMRKDPPFDMEYVYATQLLELAQAGGCRVVNDPRAIRDCNEKLFAQWFPQCCAPTLVTRDAGRIRAFLAAHGRIVLKPLDGMGGRDVYVVAPDDPNLAVILEAGTAGGARSVMAQKHVPEIAQGDKRILVVDGRAVPYALARIPAPGESRGNLAAGGRGEGRELTDRDRWIVDQVAPELMRRGLLFVGLDVIGDFLTEVNVTSPTCARELDALYGLDIAGDFLAALEARPAR
jgi:glutathione synthase